MLQARHDIKCETKSPENEFYKESYVLLEGATIEMLSRLGIIQNDVRMKLHQQI